MLPGVRTRRGVSEECEEREEGGEPAHGLMTFD
jgi:hypothetical protein